MNNWESMGYISNYYDTSYDFDFNKYRYRFVNNTLSKESVGVYVRYGMSNQSSFAVPGEGLVVEKGTDVATSIGSGRVPLQTRRAGDKQVQLYRQLLNAAPTISVTTSDAHTLYENDTLHLTGTAQDVDYGNTVTVKYSINNGTARTLHTFVSTGSAVSFDKPLTFKRDKLHDGSTAVTGDLQEGVTHTLRVWAEDDQGGKSAIHSRTFNVIPNRPEVKVNGQSRVVETIYCKVNGQAREVVKMWVKVNGELREV